MAIATEVIDRNLATFRSEISATQNFMNSKMQGLANRLELDEDGNVLENQENALIIDQIVNTAGQVIASDRYNRRGSKFINTAATIRRTIAQDYTERISGDFDRRALDSIENSAKQELRQFIFSPQVITIVTDDISQKMQALFQGSDQVSLGQVKTLIRNRITDQGPTSGTLQQIFTPSLDTALENYAADLNRSIATSLRLVWLQYQGGTIQTSRAFCIERADNYYHANEVAMWPAEEGGSWEGMIPGTNSVTIFNNRGGYNCRHNYKYVEAKDVPESDRQRANSQGFR